MEQMNPDKNLEMFGNFLQLYQEQKYCDLEVLCAPDALEDLSATSL